MRITVARSQIRGHGASILKEWGSGDTDGFTMTWMAYWVPRPKRKKGWSESSRSWQFTRTSWAPHADNIWLSMGLTWSIVNNTSEQPLILSLYSSHEVHSILRTGMLSELSSQLRLSIFIRMRCNGEFRNIFKFNFKGCSSKSSDTLQTILLVSSSSSSVPSSLSYKSSSQCLSLRVSFAASVQFQW